MRATSATIRLLITVGATILVSIPTTAQAPELPMLNQLEKGRWELRSRSDGALQQICVRTGREFIQLRHRQPGCQQLVVQDGPNEVTVQYTCRGSGYGRTTIRRESSRLVQIRSQGLLNGAPFSLDGEARLRGSC